MSSASPAALSSSILEQLSKVEDRSSARPRNPATKAAKEALIKAVLKRQLPEVAALLDSGVDPNYVIAKQGVEETPLGHSIHMRWTEGIEALLAAGARDSDATADGKPALGQFGSASLALSLPPDLATRIWDNESGAVIEKALKDLCDKPGSAACEIVVSGRVSEAIAKKCVSEWFGRTWSMGSNATYFPKVASALPGVVKACSDDLWASAIAGNHIHAVRKLVEIGAAPKSWAFPISPSDFDAWSAPDFYSKKGESNIAKWGSNGNGKSEKIAVMTREYSPSSGAVKCPAVLFAIVNGSASVAKYLARADDLLKASVEWDKAPTVAASLATATRFSCASELGFDMSHKDPTGRNILHRLIHNCDWNGNVASASIAKLIERHPDLCEDKDVNGLTPFDTKAISNETRAKLESAVITARAKAIAPVEKAKSSRKARAAALVTI